VERADTASEALLVSLNETGDIDWPRMQSLTGRQQNELQTELGGSCTATLTWTVGDCGPIPERKRPHQTRCRGAFSTTRSRLRAQRRGTSGRSAQDLEPGEIEARLGSPWIPASDVRDFLTELLDVPRASIKVAFAECIATWTVEPDYSAKYVVSNTTVHGTPRFRASELAEQALNGGHPPHTTRMQMAIEPLTSRKRLLRAKTAAVEGSVPRLGVGGPGRATRLAQDYNLRFNNIGSANSMDHTFRCRHDRTASVMAIWLLTKRTRSGDFAGWQPSFGARRRRREDLDYGGGGDGVAPVGPGEEAHVRGAESPGRSMGAEFLRLYPQARLFVAGKDHFSTGNRQQAWPHRHWELRRGDRLTPVVRVSSGVRRLFQSVRRKTGCRTGCRDQHD